MEIEITKINANGNNFIIIDDLNFDNKLLTKKIIYNICNHFNTDGLIKIDIDSNNKNIFIMNYFNNDGSWETLCMNGLTCSGFLLNNKTSKKNLQIKSNNIIYPINIINNNEIKIKVPAPQYKLKNIIINDMNGTYLDSGAKHFITEIKAWEKDEELIKTAKKIRYNKELFPKGINVNFFKILNTLSIEVKTYEKGVEKLMDSCASGSYACAYDSYQKNKLKNSIEIINPGGYFNVIFRKNKGCYIINKANLEYTKTIDLSLFL